MADPRDARLDKLFIGYVRNSTEMQRANYSEEAQRKWCKKTAIDRGYAKYNVREEPATSGQTIEGRPVFKGIIADIKKGIVGAFAAITVDRITRDDDGIDGLEFFKACRENDVLIVTKDMDFDPRNPIAIDMLMFQLMNSRHQNTANLGGLMRGLIEAAEQGRLLNGVTPFGYDRLVNMKAAQAHPRRRILTWLYANESEAKVVRLIHEWIPLMGAQKVADKLNRLDYRFPVKSPGTQERLGKTVRLWRGTDVRRIVRSPLYMGVKRWGGSRRDGKYLREMKEPIQVPIASLCIVAPAIWHANNSLLDQRNPAVTAPRSTNSPYLFRGLLKCAKCHGPMKGSRKRSGRGRKQYRVYECSTAAETGTCPGGSIGERLVRRAVQRHLVRVLQDVGLDRVLDEAIDLYLHDTEGNELQRLDDELAKLNAQQTKLLHLLLSGVLEEVEYTRERARVAEEAERLKQRRSREALRRVERITVEELRSYIGDDLLAWVPKLRGPRLSRLAKLVYLRFEVNASGEGDNRRGRLVRIQYSDDFARLLDLKAMKPGKTFKIRPVARPVSAPSNH